MMEENGPNPKYFQPPKGSMVFIILFNKPVLLVIVQITMEIKGTGGENTKGTGFEVKFGVFLYYPETKDKRQYGYMSDNDGYRIFLLWHLGTH
jgi:hypothetical protein